MLAVFFLVLGLVLLLGSGASILHGINQHPRYRNEQERLEKEQLIAFFVLVVSALMVGGALGFRAAISAAARKRYEDPEERAKTGRATRLAGLHDPTIAERKGKAISAYLATPEGREKNRQNALNRRLWEIGHAARDAESYARSGRTLSQRHGYGTWCPPEYLEMARSLRKRRFSVDEIKHIVFEQRDKDLSDLRRRMGVVE